MMTPERDQSGPRRKQPAGSVSGGLPESGSHDTADHSALFTDVRRLPSIDSTNSYVVREARRGSPEGLVVVADHQSAGRGRCDRSWVAPPGSSLLASVLMRPSFGAELIHLCGMVVGLAAVDACRESAGVDATFKWPNDLLVRDRKVAGVLAEAIFGVDAGGGPAGDGDAGQSLAAVVGLGLNLNWSGHGALMEEFEGPASALDREVGHAISREKVLRSFLVSLGKRYSALSSSAGRRSQVHEYRDRCGTIGARVRVDLSGEELVGTAVDVTLAGHLLVDTGTCIKTVIAGDVVHLRPLQR